MAKPTETQKQTQGVCAVVHYLTTYLGHVKVADTYWYLTGIPELMDFASHSFEGFFYGNDGKHDEK